MNSSSATRPQQDVGRPTKDPLFTVRLSGSDFVLCVGSVSMRFDQRGKWVRRSWEKGAAQASVARGAEATVRLKDERFGARLRRGSTEKMLALTRYADLLNDEGV